MNGLFGMFPRLRKESCISMISTVIGTPSLSAIQILPGFPHCQAPIHIFTQPAALTDSYGVTWGPDNYFMGGIFSTTFRPLKSGAETGFQANDMGISAIRSRSICVIVTLSSCTSKSSISA